MWISTIKVLVRTKDGRFVLTESRVQPAIARRNGNRVRVFRDTRTGERPMREFINWPPNDEP